MIIFETYPIESKSVEYVSIRVDAVDLVRVRLYNDAKGAFAMAPENLYLVFFEVHGQKSEFVVNALQLECIRMAIPTMVPQLQHIHTTRKQS